jgi:FMN phosphatase YigB (HAD superfamily)
MRQLRLFSRVVFVDWYGVLSLDPFWTSILESSSHPVHAELAAKVRTVFADESTVNDWMRGVLSAHDVITRMGIGLDRRFRHDFLARRLDLDCARMRVNVELLQVLRNLRPAVLVVLATDNMDCFARTFGQSHARRRRSPAASDRLADWARICDDIVCSSEVGTLKAEDPARFFGPFFAEYGLSFSDALLIDDRVENCAAFRREGGSAVQWKMSSNDPGEVVAAVTSWVETPRTSEPLSLEDLFGPRIDNQWRKPVQALLPFTTTA